MDDRPILLAKKSTRIGRYEDDVLRTWLGLDRDTHARTFEQRALVKRAWRYTEYGRSADWLRDELATGDRLCICPGNEIAQIMGMLPLTRAEPIRVQGPLIAIPAHTSEVWCVRHECIISALRDLLPDIPFSADYKPTWTKCRR